MCLLVNSGYLHSRQMVTVTLASRKDYQWKHCLTPLDVSAIFGKGELSFN